MIMNNIHDMWKGYGMVPVFKSLPPPKNVLEKDFTVDPDCVCAMEVSKIKSDQKKNMRLCHCRKGSGLVLIEYYRFVAI